MLFRVGTHGSCVRFFTDDDTFSSCMYSLTPCVGMIKKSVCRWLVLGRTDRASLQREMVPALVWGRKSGGAESGEKKRRLFERSEFLRFRVPKRKPAFFLFVTFFFWTPKRKSKSTLKK